MAHHRQPSVAQSVSGPQQIPHIQFEMPANVAIRQAPDVPEPAKHPPTDEEFFKQDSSGRRKPNASFLRSHFYREGRLTEEQALYLLECATEMLSQEENMVHVKSPVTICGDIHGQYYDLMKLFEVGGNLENNSYLFLGDYVDRGCFGIECLLYLYSLKLCYPTKFTLLRGNHECRHLTEYFTFKMECLRKYSERVYDACVRSFCALPIAALVDNRFFCVHGGISPELIKLEDLRRVNRFQEPGSSGLLCDLLWSDPIPNFGEENQVEHFIHNQNRGCSFNFTYEAACQFLERNNLMGIIRGHEAQDTGYAMHRKTPTKKFPSVITIFSAPNYLDIYRNRGAVIKYANKNITIRQYNSSAHPYWLPNFMDAFTWSLPFVGAKIIDMLLAILSICSQEELLDSSSDSEEEARRESELLMSPTDLQKRRAEIKGKIMAVGRIQQIFMRLREDAENATELGNESSLSPNDHVDEDRLGIQSNMIRRNVHSFAQARAIDHANERIPGAEPNMPGGFIPPSMKRRGSGDGEHLGEGYNGEAVERLAERIASGAHSHSRRGTLRRFGTT